MDKCEICSKKSEPVPYNAVESMMDRLDSANKRLIGLCTLLLVLLACAVAFIFWQRNQFESYEETYEIEQDTDGGGNNYSVIGGDFNGEAENQGEEEGLHP